MRIFVSSTMQDLKEVRQELAKVIQEFGHEPILAENYVNDPLYSQSPEEVIKEMIEKADVYFGIFHEKWGEWPKKDNPPADVQEYIKGWPPNEPLSVTAYEYYLARKKGIPVVIFVSNERKEWRLEMFIEKIKDYHEGIFYQKYNTIEDLILRARKVLGKLISNELRNFLEKQKEKFIVVNEIQGKPLKDFYVPNELVKVSIDTWNMDEDEIIGREEWNFIDFLKGDERLAVIAGEFGTGKSSLCYHIAYELAEVYLSYKDDYYGYIPILVELRREFRDVYGENYSLDYVLDHIIELDRTGRKVLLLLDGLDETPNVEKVLEKIDELLNRSPNIKIILTTRLVKDYYNFFIRPGTPLSFKKYYVRIKNFNENQAYEFFEKFLGLEKGKGKEIYEYFKKLGLTDKELRKPLLALMLAKIYKTDKDVFSFNENELNKIKDEDIRHRILRAYVYHEFAYSLLRGKHRELVERYPQYVEWSQFYKEEKELLRVLAALSNMYGGEIRNYSEKLQCFDIQGGSARASEDLKKALDMVITSYFTGNEEAIRFIHRSFQEYFLAEYYYEMLSKGKTDMLNVGTPTIETMDFLHGIIDMINYADILKKAIRRKKEDERRDEIDEVDLIKIILEKDSEVIKKTKEEIIKHAKEVLEDKYVIFPCNTLNHIGKNSGKMLIDTYKTLLVPKWIAASVISWLNYEEFSDISDEGRESLVETILLSGLLPGYLKNLKGANLREADLSKANLSLANLREADLSKARLIEANLSMADLSKANLREADLSQAELREADLSQAELSLANLSKANLWEVDLPGANLSMANLRGAKLSKVDLSKVDLSKADLRGANLSLANLKGAKLSGADLSQADLRGADLSQADLRGANLSGATLKGANLSGARLSFTDLSGADLSYADLSDVMFYLLTWDDYVSGSKNLVDPDEVKRLLELDKLEESVQYKLEGNKLEVEMGSYKITVTLEEGRAILKRYSKNSKEIQEEELLVVKEDGKSKLYRNVRVSEDTKTAGIILTHDNDEQSIIKALENLPPDFRRIVLRDNPLYKSIWDRRSSLGNTSS